MSSKRRAKDYPIRRARCLDSRFTVTAAGTTFSGASCTTVGSKRGPICRTQLRLLQRHPKPQRSSRSQMVVLQERDAVAGSRFKITEGSLAMRSLPEVANRAMRGRGDGGAKCSILLRPKARGKRALEDS